MNTSSVSCEMNCYVMCRAVSVNVIKDMSRDTYSHALVNSITYVPIIDDMRATSLFTEQVTKDKTEVTGILSKDRNTDTHCGASIGRNEVPTTIIDQCQQSSDYRCIVVE